MQEKNRDTAFHQIVVEKFQNIQSSICSALELADGSGQKFSKDEWQRPEGGGGLTRVFSQGDVIEKGGVNFSKVYGEVTSLMAEKLHMTEGNFLATGVSIVLHPQNPFVPIIHMNIRYFESQGNDGSFTYWFGGGIDLTPHYVDKEDAQYFHNSLRKVCDLYHPNFYPKYKKWADDYFFIKHRNETRGIGGVFFDRVQESENFSKENLFDFVLDLGESFAPIYTHLMHKNKDKTYNDKHKQWQYLRRGRYVEFNLVYDAGTKFGLETNGRIESILMSLPPQAQWTYDFKPEANSPEEKTLQMLKKGIDWV
ncbi:MAG: oxygen-dependent coproporphyrinogen oxidase [Raineya sp.]|nr:oxygen-dependent coproporphyrinogen oxidase [Raineya sp.]